MHFICLKFNVHDICFCMHFVLYLYLSLLFLLVCRRYHVLFTLFAFFAHSGVQHILCCVSFSFSFSFFFERNIDILKKSFKVNVHNIQNVYAQQCI